MAQTNRHVTSTPINEKYINMHIIDKLSGDNSEKKANINRSLTLNNNDMMKPNFKSTNNSQTTTTTATTDLVKVINNNHKHRKTLSLAMAFKYVLPAHFEFVLFYFYF